MNERRECALASLLYDKEDFLMVIRFANFWVGSAVLVCTFCGYADSSFIDDSKAFLTDAGQNMTDAAITTKVKTLFVQEKLFSDSGVAMPVTDISVTTQNRVVYLSGTVPTKAVADRAVALAKSLEGVRGVVSTLKVK